MGSRNQTRFQKMQSTGQGQVSSKQAQMAAMLSNSYKHQQRKLSYSPVLKQTLPKRKNALILHYLFLARKRAA